MGSEFKLPHTTCQLKIIAHGSLYMLHRKSVKYLVFHLLECTYYHMAKIYT